jgi:hypothetical protein
MNNARIGAAVLGGYVLGRTKKAKLALGLGALLAGSRIRPGQLGKALDAPFLGQVGRQVRSELGDASKAAASSVLTAKAESLADALHQRTAGLQDKAHEEAEGDRGEEEEPQAEKSEDEEPEGEEPQSKARRAPARRKKTAAAQSGSKRGGTSRSRRQDDA